MIVDWKTGKTPEGDELERKSLQLALYRAAWSAWSGTPAEEIDAVFWFSQEAKVVPPTQLPSRAELEQLLIGAKERSAEKRL